MINRPYRQRRGKRSLFEDSLSRYFSVFCSFVAIQSFILIVVFFSPPYFVSNKTSDETKETINHRLIKFYNRKNSNTQKYIDHLIELYRKRKLGNKLKIKDGRSINIQLDKTETWFLSLTDIQSKDILLTISYIQVNLFVCLSE